ncbi:MAG: hypothetical protein JWS10_3318 [Cypionkella sp.]|nr:hypothetical protein [Cypionkella sp.]
MNLSEKIQARLDILECDLGAGKHLVSDENKTEMNYLVGSISKFSSILSDTERDFLNAAKSAIADDLPWK